MKVKICVCGCGTLFYSRNKYIKNHFKQSEKTKKNLSLSRMGKDNPMFGRHHSEEVKSRISNKLKGKIFSEETKNKISLSKKGENNCQWLGGITSKFYGPGNTEEIREQIRSRDKHTCQECGKVWNKKGKRFSPHHIDYDKNNHEMWNRITLCRSCHAKTNMNRDYWREKLFLFLLARFNRLLL